MEKNNFLKNIDKPLVSICCLTYNHENFIKKTLDGFINQKTSFNFEVLIHDDASTDKTQSIIKEYASRYPNIIKPILQKENQLSKGINVQKTYNYPRIKGKYVAYCEGDDYWSDINKLQLQVEYLENNKNCTICTHITEKISKDGSELNLFFPPYETQKKIWTLEDYLLSEIKNSYWTFQLSSFMVKKEIIDLLMSGKIEFVNSFYRVGDFPLIVLALTQGDLIYINRNMSSYRCMSGGFMSHWYSNKEFASKVNNGFIMGYTKIDEYTNHKYHYILDEGIKKYQFQQLILEEKFQFLKSERYMQIYKLLPYYKKVALTIGRYSKFLYHLILKFNDLLKRKRD